MDGIPLSAQEIQDLLAQSEVLALLKGRWVEVDHAQLQQLLDAMDAQAGEVTMMEALRMDLNGKKGGCDPDLGVVIKNGTWLDELLTKLKQICNQPDQYLGQEEYAPQESGKFVMLGELCETIYEKRERVLVFTQFKEITPNLDEYLAQLFHCRGFVLHGGTPVAERAKMVEAFQSERYVPYMVLSVRAGGIELNLTNASHVIHFDRWWNPAGENQATDRAYRIGQKRNVMVHKLLCQGTVEEKIDQLIESEKELPPMSSAAAAKAGSQR